MLEAWRDGLRGRRTPGLRHSLRAQVRPASRGVIWLRDLQRSGAGVAEREGFEPSRRFPAYTLSRRAPSTTRPPLRCGDRNHVRRGRASPAGSPAGRAANGARRGPVRAEGLRDSRPRRRRARGRCRAKPRRGGRRGRPHAARLADRSPGGAAALAPGLAVRARKHPESPRRIGPRPATARRFSGENLPNPGPRAVRGFAVQQSCGESAARRASAKSFFSQGLDQTPATKCRLSAWRIGIFSPKTLMPGRAG